MWTLNYYTLVLVSTLVSVKGALIQMCYYIIVSLDFFFFTTGLNINHCKEKKITFTLKYEIKKLHILLNVIRWRNVLVWREKSWWSCPLGFFFFHRASPHSLPEPQHHHIVNKGTVEMKALNLLPLTFGLSGPPPLPPLSVFQLGK